MNFDAGNFFKNVFNSIGKTSKTKLSETQQKQVSNAGTKYLPDEAPDEKVIINDKAEMDAILQFEDSEPTDTNVLKYAVPNPEPKGEETVKKYAIPDSELIHEESIVKYAVPNPELTGEETVKKYAIPDSELIHEESIVKYAVPNPEPTGEETVKKYAIPDSELIHEESIVKYAVPNSEPTGEETVKKYAIPDSVPTEPTVSPTPQPSIPQNPVNPWRVNIMQTLTNIFGGRGSSFAQRVMNNLTKFFSR